MVRLKRSRFESILLGLSLSLPLLYAGILDYVGAVTLFPIALAFFLFGGLVVGGIFCIHGPRRPILIGVGLYFFALVALRLIALTPVKPFRAFYDSVKPGMSEAAVLDKFSERFPEAGRFRRPEVRRHPDVRGLTFALDPTDGRYNSEYVMIDLEDGRVVSKNYLPD